MDEERAGRERAPAGRPGSRAQERIGRGIWRPRSPTARIAVAVTAVMLVGVALVEFGAAQEPLEASQRSVVATDVGPGDPAPPTTAATPLPEPTTAVAEAPIRTVEESGGFRLTLKSSGSCTAEAPADWTLTTTARSNTADLADPTGALYAGYGIQAVNTALAGYASAYPAPLNDPALYSEDPATAAAAYARIVLSALGGSPDLADTGEPWQAIGAYQLREVASSTHRGVIFFHATGIPGDGVNYTYALPMYFAFTTSDRWEAQGNLVARVAASIRCSTQLQPPSDSLSPGDPTGGSTGDDPNGADAGYNPQLGTEYATDPTTGENYLVDPSTNWSDTGPAGPGYYVPKGGGDYQKLEPGRSD